MGKIPEFQQRFRASTVDASRISRAGAIGRGISRLGNTAARSIEQYERAKDIGEQKDKTLQEKKDRVDAENYKIEASLAYEKKTAEYLENFKEESLQDPKNSSRNFEEALRSDKDIQLLIDDAPNDIAKRQVENMIKLANGKNVSQAKKQENIAYIQSTKQRKDNNIKEVETQSYMAGLDQADAMLKKTDMVLGPMKEVTNKEVYEGELAEARSGVLFNAFKSEIEKGNFKKTEEAFKNKEYKKILGADNLSRIQRTLAKAKKTSADKAQKIEHLRLSDPYKYGDKKGDPAPIVNILDFKNLTAQLNERMVYVEDKRNSWANNRMELFRKEEIDQVNAILANRSSEQKTVMLEELKEKMPPETFSSFSRMMYKKNPIEAVAFSIIDKGQQGKVVANELLDGAELMKAGTFKPDESEIALTVQGQLRGAINNEAALAQITKGITALYAKRASQKGVKDPEILSEDILTESIEAITGPAVSFNGKRTLSFQKEDGEFATEDEIEDIVEDLNTDSIKILTGRTPVDRKGRPLEYEDFINRGELYPVSNGVYKMIINHNGAKQVIRDKEGNDMELDLSKAEAMMKSGELKVSLQPKLSGRIGEEVVNL